MRPGRLGYPARPEEALRRPLDRDLAADALLDRIEREYVVVAGEGHRGPECARPAGAADPVDVVFGVFRKVVVDDVGDALDVQPPRGNIRRDEDREPTVLEFLEHLQATVLWNVAGESARRVAVCREPANEVGRRRAAVDEDEDAAAALLLEQPEQQAELLRRGHVEEQLRDPVRQDSLGLDFHLFGVVGVLVRELHHSGRQRCRKEERLAPVVGRAAAQYAAQILDEAHVEHPVRFVDHQDLHVAERDGPLLLVVEQTAGRADEQVGDPLHRLPLELVVDAPEDRQRRQPRVWPEHLGVRADLGDELAGGRDDQGARTAGRVGRFLLEKPRKNRDQKCRGLARPGLGLSGHVAPRQ